MFLVSSVAVNVLLLNEMPEKEEGRVPLAENKITHQRAQPFNIVNSVEFNLNCYKNECINSNITILIDCQCLIKLPHTYTNRFGCKQFSYAESKQFSYGIEIQFV